MTTYVSLRSCIERGRGFFSPGFRARKNTDKTGFPAARPYVDNTAGTSRAAEIHRTGD